MPLLAILACFAPSAPAKCLSLAESQLLGPHLDRPRVRDDPWTRLPVFRVRSPPSPKSAFFTHYLNRLVRRKNALSLLLLTMLAMAVISFQVRSS